MENFIRTYDDVISGQGCDHLIETLEKQTVYSHEEWDNENKEHIALARVRGLDINDTQMTLDPYYPTLAKEINEDIVESDKKWIDLEEKIAKLEDDDRQENVEEILKILEISSRRLKDKNLKESWIARVLEEWRKYQNEDGSSKKITENEKKRREILRKFLDMSYKWSDAVRLICYKWQKKKYDYERWTIEDDRMVMIAEIED